MEIREKPIKLGIFLRPSEHAMVRTAAASAGARSMNQWVLGLIRRAVGNTKKK
jgi:predicted HicB family RNase H-like nuclease